MWVSAKKLFPRGMFYFLHKDVSHPCCWTGGHSGAPSVKPAFQDRLKPKLGPCLLVTSYSPGLLLCRAAWSYGHLPPPWPPLCPPERWTYSLRVKRATEKWTHTKFCMRIMCFQSCSAWLWRGASGPGAHSPWSPLYPTPNLPTVCWLFDSYFPAPVFKNLYLKGTSLSLIYFLESSKVLSINFPRKMSSCPWCQYHVP